MLVAHTAVVVLATGATLFLVWFLFQLERLLPASIPLSSLPLDTPFATDPAP